MIFAYDEVLYLPAGTGTTVFMGEVVEGIIRSGDEVEVPFWDTRKVWTVGTFDKNLDEIGKGVRVGVAIRGWPAVKNLPSSGELRFWNNKGDAR